MEDNFWYLFVAYSLIWAVLLGYVYSLFVRERNLERELDSLKGRLRSRSRDEERRPGEGAAPIPRDGSELFEEVAPAEGDRPGP
jgi:CcmD family protein